MISNSHEGKSGAHIVEIKDLDGKSIDIERSEDEVAVPERPTQEIVGRIGNRDEIPEINPAKIPEFGLHLVGQNHLGLPEKVNRPILEYPKVESDHRAKPIRPHRRVEEHGLELVEQYHELLCVHGKPREERRRFRSLYIGNSQRQASDLGTSPRFLDRSGPRGARIP